jgi:hypothetical protein
MYALPPYIPGKNLNLKGLYNGYRPLAISNFRIAFSRGNFFTLGKTLYGVESDGWEKSARIFA